MLSCLRLFSGPTSGVCVYVCVCVCVCVCVLSSLCSMTATCPPPWYSSYCRDPPRSHRIAHGLFWNVRLALTTNSRFRDRYQPVLDALNKLCGEEQQLEFSNQVGGALWKGSGQECIGGVVCGSCQECIGGVVRNGSVLGEWSGSRE